MYPSSSQRKFWTFTSEREIADLRVKHNQNFVLKQNDALLSLGIDVSY